MNILSMLVESFRVANKVENAGPGAGLGHAERFADNCSGTVAREMSESGRSGDFEILDAAFMKPF